MATDPVCGMEVEPERAAGSSEYKGTTYYFCAGGCKDRFDTAPGRYIPEGEGLREDEPAGKAFRELKAELTTGPVVTRTS